MPDDKDREKVPSGWPPEGGGPLKVPFEFKSRDLRKVFVVGVIIVVLVILAFLVITGQGGMIEVTDTQVAVIVSYLSGNKEVVDTPGYVIFIPWLQQAYRFDRSPNDFVMTGTEDRSWNQVRRLTVRAVDGSNFWFETLRVQYQMIPSAAAAVLEDSGSEDAFKQNWVRAFARSVLRDEFGKFAAEDVTIPANQTQAKNQAMRRLNEALAAHGVEILAIITPNPKFDPAYERAIEERKQANQEVERLKVQVEQLEREKDRRLAEVRRDKETMFKDIEKDLKALRIVAERDRIELEKSAEAFQIEQVNLGRGQEQSMKLEAEGLVERARKEAEGLSARVLALARRGEILVREALAKKLASIRFTVVPYQRDPSPLRIEHLGGAVPPGGQQ